MTTRDIWTQLGESLAQDETQLIAYRAQVGELSSGLAEAGQVINQLNLENSDLLAKNAELSRKLAECQASNKPFIWGVASHQCTYRDETTSVFAQDEKMFAIHDQLPKHRIRDQLNVSAGDPVWDAEILPLMKRHGEAGRTFELTIGNWKGMFTYPFDRAKKRLRQLVDLGLLSGVAGINEPDDSGNGGVSFSMNTYAQHQKRIWDMMMSDPVLAKIPVANGAIRGENATWFETNKKFIEACKPYMNEANWHWYPFAGDVNITEAEVRAEFKAKMDSIKAIWSGPIYISECGATTANVSLEKQAWIDMLLLDLCEAAGVKCIIYKAACDGPNMLTFVQRNFGIFNYDGTPRLAAQQIAAR